MRALVLFTLLAPLALAQDPFRVASDHYHLVFENAWARATRVTYEPHSSAPVHEHPPTPTTVYIYVTDGDVMSFHHVSGDDVAGHTFNRKPVKAGAIRFAHGAPETHSVDYQGDAPTEYARIELRTEPLDRPVRDVRLPPFEFTDKPSAMETQFENRQVRILRVRCGPGSDCPASANPADRAVVVTMSGAHKGEIAWSPRTMLSPGEYVRVELKTRPVAAR